MKEEQKALGINIALGLVAGYASWNVHVHSFSHYASLQGFLVGLAFFALVSFVVKLTIGKKTLKWLMSKGGGWYFWGAWFIMWTVLYNVLSP